MRNVHFIQVYRRGPWVIIDIQANAFLLHMVRNIAGVLLAVGSGQAPAGWPAQVLASRDRTQGGVTARPEGRSEERRVGKEGRARWSPRQVERRADDRQRTQ